MRRVLVSALFCIAVASGQTAAPLPELLDRIGKQVETLTEQLSAVACKESVDQLKLTPQGKAVAEKRETYDYVMLLQKVAGRLTVDESRQRVGGPVKEPNKALLVTGGFSVLALIFHPEYQSGYLFREVPGETEGEMKIAFEAVPGAHSPSVISLKSRDYAIAWKGTALVDNRTGALLRIEASLANSMQEIGLESLEAVVSYAPVAFRDPPANYLLPLTAVIDARTKRQRWRNRHDFTAYRRFSVETEVRIGED
jgi:hypothetical protein